MHQAHLVARQIIAVALVAICLFARAVSSKGIYTLLWDNTLENGPSPGFVDESGLQTAFEKYQGGYGFGRTTAALDRENGIWYFGLRRVDDRTQKSVIIQYDINKKQELARIEVEPEPIFHTLVWHPVQKLLYCFRQSVYGNETEIGTLDMKSGYNRIALIRQLANVWRADLDVNSNTVFAYATGRRDTKLWYHRINLQTGDSRNLDNGNFANFNLTFWGRWNPATKQAVAVAYQYTSTDPNQLPEQWVVTYEEKTMKFTTLLPIQRPDEKAGLISWTLDPTTQKIYAVYHIIFQPDPNLWILTIDAITGKTLTSQHLKDPYLPISAMAIVPV